MYDSLNIQKRTDRTPWRLDPCVQSSSVPGDDDDDGPDRWSRWVRESLSLADHGTEWWTSTETMADRPPTTNSKQFREREMMNGNVISSVTIWPWSVLHELIGAEIVPHPSLIWYHPLQTVPFKDSNLLNTTGMRYGYHWDRNHKS